MTTTENRSPLENLEAAQKSYAAAKIASAAEIAAARENLAALENARDIAEANAKLARDLAIGAAKNAGASISAIARAVGTSDRGTIYRIIERVNGPTPTPPAATTASTAHPENGAEPQAVVQPHTTSMGPGWLVTWDDGEAVELLDRDGVAVPLGRGAGRKRWEALDTDARPALR